VSILSLTRLSFHDEHTACDDRKATFSHIAEDVEAPIFHMWSRHLHIGRPLFPAGSENVKLEWTLLEQMAGST